MGNFLRGHWMYILLGFLIVLVAGMGYLTYSRLQQLNKPPEITIQPFPTLTSAPSTSTAELSFSLTNPTPPGTEAPVCIDLTATPARGTAPQTVAFSGTALAADGTTTLTFNFTFGDNAKQSVDRQTTSADNTETQQISHTYTIPGSYTATLIVEDENGVASDQCETQVQIGGLAQAISTTPAAGLTPGVGGPTQPPQLNTTPTAVASSLTGTPAPTLIALTTVAPTRIPTPTLIAGAPTPTSIPAPNIPQSGGFFPTVLTGLAGIALIVLPFLL